MKVVQIPNVGNVQFPDTMNDDQVTQAAGELHQQANQPSGLRGAPQKPLTIAEVMQHLSQQPTQGTMSEHLKKMGTLAKTLEENPQLAQLAIWGLQRARMQRMRITARPQ